MSEVPLFVLVLQIGLNAALSHHGISNPLIPGSRFTNNGQSRRLQNFNQPPSLGSGISISDYDYSSLEANNLRTLDIPSLHPHQTQNNYLRYSTNAHNAISLERPIGRIGPDNNAKTYRTDATTTNYKRFNPFVQNRRFDLSLDVSSSESASPEDTSIKGENAKYLRSLMSLIELTDDRRKLSNNFGNSAFSDSFHSNPTHVYRRKNRKSNRNYKTYLRSETPSKVKDSTDPQIDAILLVSSKVNPKSNSRGTEVTSRRKNKKHQTELDLSSFELSSDDKHSNEYDSLITPSHLRGHKSRSRSQKYSGGSKKHNRNDRTELRSHDQNHNNKKNNKINFLRLAMTPNDRLSLDEDMASDLSELISESIDKLNLEPARRKHASNQKYRRKDNNHVLLESVEEEPLNNLSVFTLRSLYGSSDNSPLIRRESTNRRRSKNRGNKSTKPQNNNGNDNPNNKDCSVIRIDKVDNDNPELNVIATDRAGFKNDLLNISATKPDNSSVEPPLLNSTSNETEQNFTTSVLELEYPWNDPFSSGNSKKNNQSTLQESKPLLRFDEQADIDLNKDPKDYDLVLEYPWNGETRRNKDIDDTDSFYPETSNSNNEHPYLRNLRLLFEQKSVSRSNELNLDNEKGPIVNNENNGTDNKFGSFDENQDLQAFRKVPDREADFYDYYYEVGDSAEITFPTDRRPHHVLRTQEPSSTSTPVPKNQSANDSADDDSSNIESEYYISSDEENENNTSTTLFPPHRNVQP